MKQSLLEAKSKGKQSITNNPILFVGNGPYRNRGCEAIVRGSMEILSDAFGMDLDARAGVMASPVTVDAQQAKEPDPRITNFPVSHVGSRFSKKWMLSQANRFFKTQFHTHTNDLGNKTAGASCALQMGGDNYSLDYGLPWDYIAVDRYLQKRNIPVILWGASVGPFDQDSTFAPIMHRHLKTLSGIFVRETASQEYLATHGIIDNVYLVADPAFCMVPSEPWQQSVKNLVSDDTIGINISPLVARFSDYGGDLDGWRSQAANMITETAKLTRKPILLVPHVASPKLDEDDFSFMQSLCEIVRERIPTKVAIAPSNLDGAEMKWLIGQCSVFAGARTHSTIAALSSGVPTLSLSYSVKAIGINQDIFGHQNYCKSVKTIRIEHFAAEMEQLVDQADSVRQLLEKKIPEIKARAKHAGKLLKEILQRDSDV